MIPKTIYQTYYGNQNDPLPLPIQKNILYIKTQNPNWTYKLYRDDEIVEFISSHYPSSILQAYLKINSEYGVARADFFRYLLIYKKGGVYMDIKSAPLRPLDESIKDDDVFIFSHWNTKPHAKRLDYPLGEIQNWYIISSKDNPFLKAVIDNVYNNIKNYKDGVGKEGVLKLTGPIIYSQTIIPLLKDYTYTQYTTNTLAGMKYQKISNYKSLFPNHYSLNTTKIVKQGF